MENNLKNESPGGKGKLLLVARIRVIKDDVGGAISIMAEAVIRDKNLSCEMCGR